jgi:hypothetical protein
MSATPTAGTYNADGSLNVTSTGAAGATSANQTAVQAPVAPASATATKSTLGGNQYNATPPSPTDGQQLSTQADAKGSTKVAICDSTGAPVSLLASSYARVAAGTATSTIKSGAGTLYAICINTKGASANTMTVYDNTAASGTVIALIDGTSDRDHQYGGGIAFTTGLTIASATGTGADYTVVYV